MTFAFCLNQNTKPISIWPIGQISHILLKGLVFWTISHLKWVVFDMGQKDGYFDQSMLRPLITFFSLKFYTSPFFWKSCSFRQGVWGSNKGYFSLILITFFYQFLFNINISFSERRLWCINTCFSLKVNILFCVYVCQS